MKKILFLLFFIGLFTISVDSVFGQTSTPVPNTQCVWETYPLVGGGYCREARGCPSGYSPSVVCVGRSRDICSVDYCMPLTPTPVPTSALTPTPGAGPSSDCIEDNHILPGPWACTPEYPVDCPNILRYCCKDIKQCYNNALCIEYRHLTPINACPSSGYTYDCPSVLNTCCQEAKDCPTSSSGRSERENALCTGYPEGYENERVNTAIGCIPTNINTLASWLLTWAMGIGGGIAFLLMLYAGFQIMISSGDPQRAQAGKELLTSAVSGLLLIIFSILILRLIGIEIFHIPGISLLRPSSAYAADDSVPTVSLPKYPAGFRFGSDTAGLGDVISYLLPRLMVFAGLGLFLYIIFSGFKMLTGASNPESFEKGKKTLTNAIIGFIIVFCAYWLVQLLEKVFNVTLLNWE